MSEERENPCDDLGLRLPRSDDHRARSSPKQGFGNCQGIDMTRIGYRKDIQSALPLTMPDTAQMRLGAALATTKLFELPLPSARKRGLDVLPSLTH
jgi:hypothetical protein